MSRTRKSLGVFSVIFGILLAASCSDNRSGLQDNTASVSNALSVVPRLTPPAEYVLAPGGTARQTLEQAGILKSDGRPWAKVLGKALFWDQQTGSDGNACASCHFAAGADPRIKNQLSPGFNDVSFGPDGDKRFGSLESDTGVRKGVMPSGAKAEANYTLKPQDFPLHQLSNKKDRNSPLITTTNDVVSSQGAFEGTFTDSRHGLTHDPAECTPPKSKFRQVEPRNTPTTINAAFFFSNFWDGRANNLFNGVGTFGLRDIAGDPNKRLIVFDGGKPILDYLQVHNASLASQAVAPPVSVREMSCEDRTFADVGRKLLGIAPLFQQKVDGTDSLLGPYANPSGKGLLPQYGYSELIKKAFDEKYWNAPGRYRIANGVLVQDATGYTQMEINFSMFWGLAIMLYEQTLVSDQSRFDDWFESCRPKATNAGAKTAVPIANPDVICQPDPDNPNQSIYPTMHGFTAQEVLGFGLFNNGGAVGGDPNKLAIRDPGNPACSGCHPIINPVNGDPVVFPTFSEAAFQEGQPFVPVERSRIDDLGFGLAAVTEGGTHDRGFFNLGLRPVSDDLGAGGKDPYGNDLSITRMFLHEQAGETVVDPSGIGNRCATSILEPGGTPPYPGCPAPTVPPTPPPPPTTLLDLAVERHLVDGTFKTPSLRNVGLTAPYFHYGAYATLRSVVEVYARGANKRNMNLTVPGATGDSSGSGRFGNETAPPTGPNFGTNVDFFIRDIKSTDGTIDSNGDGYIDWKDDQIGALVAFMLTLTDPRVQCDLAPFDHPELTLSNGHPSNVNQGNGHARDNTFVLPAVGASGYAGGPNARFCMPNAGNLFASGIGPRRGE